MEKRSSYEIKKKILRILREKPATYAQLERGVNTGYSTIKNNVEELKHFGNLEIEKKPRHEATGRPYYLVTITKQGKDFLKSIED